MIKFYSLDIVVSFTSKLKFIPKLIICQKFSISLMLWPLTNKLSYASNAWVIIFNLTTLIIIIPIKKGGPLEDTREPHNDMV